MKLRIDLDTNNAAFEDDFEGELRRILKGVAQYMACNRHNDDPIDLRDINGNKCGTAWLEHDLNDDTR